MQTLCLVAVLFTCPASRRAPLIARPAQTGVRSRWRLRCLLSLSLSGCASLLYAQTQPVAEDANEPYATIPLPAAAITAPTPTTLAPITVVGTHTPRRLDDSPSAIAQISARDIEGAQASDLGQVLADTPGVAIEGGPRANAQFLNVRGLSGARVLVIVDGARQNFQGGHRSSLLADPALLKQVELLRGPASALWGSDAVGGVLVLTTRDGSDFLQPGEQFATRLRTGYESAADARLTSGIAAAAAGDLDAVVGLVSRSAADYRRGDGEREPQTALDTRSGLAKFRWQPNAGPHSLRVIRQDFRQSGASPSNPSTRVTETNPLIDRRNDAAYSIAQYHYDGVVPLGLRGAQLNVYRDQLDITENRVDEPRADQTRFLTDGANGHLSLRLPEGWTAGALLTIGGETFRDRSRATRDGGPRPQYPDARRTLSGGFVQAEIDWGRFTLIPGLRYDQYQAESSQADAAPIRESAVSPKLGVVWQLGSGLNLRASVNTAFRAPGLVEVYASGQHFLGNDFVPNPELRPEKARSLELGLSWERAGWRPEHQWRLSGSIYRNTVKDYIELFVAVESEFPAPRCVAPMPPRGCVNRSDDGLLNPLVPPVFVGGTTSSRNLPSATLEGGELEVRYALGSWGLGAQFSTVRGGDDRNGMPLLTIPADRARLALDWTPRRHLQTRLAYTRNLAQTRVPTFDDENGDPQPIVPPTPGSGHWDLQLSWEPLGTNGRAFGLHAPRIVLGVDNLTDTFYRTHLNVLDSPGRSLRAGLSAGF